MGRKRFAKRKEKRRGIARERIRILMGLAQDEALSGRSDRSARYMHLARKIGKRYNVRMPKGHKLLACSKCGAYRIPGKTSRTRTASDRLIVTCLNCGHVYRRPMRPEKKPEGKRGG